ncbi:MAG: porin [Pseudomonadota bacterium]
MKKVLFATSALVACAGMAAAEVTVGGSGRIGLVYNNQKTNGVKNNALATTRVEKRMTINIDGSGSTDVGLDFGGRIRIRSDERAGSAVAAANVWVGNDTFRVTVGNTDGAMLNRINYYQGSVGLTGLHWANVSFNIGTRRFLLSSYSSRGGATADVVRLDFNVGGFGVSLSTDQTGTTLKTPARPGSESAIAASYNFGDWTVAAGFAKNVNNATTGPAEQDMTSISISGSIGDFGVGLGWSDIKKAQNANNGGNKVVLSGSYNFGDTTVTGFVARTSADVAGTIGFAAGKKSETEVGLGFTHSLGGATLAGGISRNFQKNIQADVGIRFSF